MNLSLLCQEHNKPCRLCASSKILWNKKLIHGAIAHRIEENIQAVPCGMDTYELQYQVLMKRDGILKKLYPTEEAIGRLETAERQTAGMIRQKSKKGQLWEIEAVNEIFKKELNVGTVEVLTVDEFKRRAENEPTAFTRLNLAFNPDSLSTPVRLFHDFTTAVSSTTLSLEVLTLDNALGSMIEASLSFRLFELIQCWDIAKCYTQITLVGQFVLCSLNLWFKDIKTSW